MTVLGVFLAALLPFQVNSPFPTLYTKSKSYFFSLFMNQDQVHTPADRPQKVKSQITSEMQLHLKQVFDSINSSSPLETYEENFDQQNFDHAIKDLKTADDEEDRAYAVTVIGSSNKSEAIPALAKALDDPSSLVRQEALERILGWPDIKSQEIMLIAALKSNDPDVIYVALESIYETKNKALLHQIKRLRKNKDKEIAKLASEVYKNLTE